MSKTEPLGKARILAQERLPKKLAELAEPFLGILKRFDSNSTTKSDKDDEGRDHTVELLIHHMKELPCLKTASLAEEWREASEKREPSRSTRTSGKSETMRSTPSTRQSIDSLAEDLTNIPAFTKAAARETIETIHRDDIEDTGDVIEAIQNAMETAMKERIQNAIERRQGWLQERHKSAQDILMDASRTWAQSLLKEGWEKADLQHEMNVDLQKALILLGEADVVDFRISLSQYISCETWPPFLVTLIKRCRCKLPFNLYYNSVRLRITVFGVNTLVLAIAAFSGLLIETFMMVFTPLVQEWMFEPYIIFGFLPFFMMVFASFCEGVIRLTIDAANTVPLGRWQASLLQALTFLTGPRATICMVWATMAVLANVLPQFWPQHVLAYKVLKVFCLILIIGAEFAILKYFSCLESPSKFLQPITFLEHTTIIKRLRGWLHIELPMQVCIFGIISTLLFFIGILVLIWSDFSIQLSTLLSGLVSILMMLLCEDPHSESMSNRGLSPQLWDRRLVDATYLLLFELCPVCSGIWGGLKRSQDPDGRGLLGAIARSFLWGAVFAVIVATAIQQVCIFFMAVRSSKSWRSWRQNVDLGRAREYQNRLTRVFHKDFVAPGTLSLMPREIFAIEEYNGSMIGVAWFKNETMRRRMSSWLLAWFVSLAVLLYYTIDLIQRFQSPQDTWARTIWVYVLAFLVLILFPLILLRVLSSSTPGAGVQSRIPMTLGWLFWTVGVALFSWKPQWLPQDSTKWLPFLCPTFLFVAVLASYTGSRELPGLTARVYWMMSILFWILFSVLLMSPSFALQPFGAAVKIVDKSTIAHPADVQRDASLQYDLCKHRYGDASDQAELTALDLSQLAGLTYDENCDRIRSRLETVFDDLTSTHESVPQRRPAIAHYCKDVPKDGTEPEFPRFVVFDIGTNKSTRVIAFKGTSTNKDVYTDAMLFSAIKVLQVFERLVPTIALFPIDQIQWFLFRAHFNSQIRMEKEFWDKTVQSISKYVDRDHNIILTGHSLGGAIAQVMAARLNLPALVWSSPGVSYSAARFGVYEREDWRSWIHDHQTKMATKDFGVQILKHRVHNVIPDFDAVPKVDAHVSLTDHIECRGPAGEFLGAASCHSLNRTSCEVWRVCGDVYNRVFDCGEYVSQSGMNAFEKPDDIF